LPIIKTELDNLFSDSIPIFITAGRLYFALTGQKETKGFKFSRIYKEGSFIDPKSNVLNRTIIPLFRNKNYLLLKKPEYLNKIGEFLEFLKLEGKK